MQKFALLSVSDKTGITEFAESLVRQFGYTILSTGGTAKLLRDQGLEVMDVSEHTGFPEMMDGRVKTLHPKIHGGLLPLRENENHMKAALDHGIEMIDLVAVNLYPFEETVAQRMWLLKKPLNKLILVVHPCCGVQPKIIGMLLLFVILQTIQGY